MRTDTETMASAVRRMLLAVCLAILALFFTLRPLDFSFPGVHLDDSWVAVLGEAVRQPARWGVDLAFTYGPASALVTRYFTDLSLTLTLPMAVGVAIAFGLSFERLLALSGASRGQTLATVAVIAVVLMGTRSDEDSFFFALALIVYLLDLRRPHGDGASLSAVAVGGLAMGVAGLSKTGFAITGLALFLLADVRSVVFMRRWPVLVPAWTVGFGLTFLACGQHVADLPVFLRLQASVVAGYGEAMSLAGPRAELVGFLATAVSLVATLVLSGRRRPPSDCFQKTFAMLGTLGVLMIGFKAGFVRQDTHPQIAWLLLGLLCIVTAVGIVLPQSRPLASVLMVSAPIIVWGVAPILFLVESGAVVDRAGLLDNATDTRDIYADTARNIGRFLRGPAEALAEAEDAKASAWAAIRAHQPLPSLAGPVDIIPSEQASVLAHGLDYRPRPSFQNYSTYTQALIDANSAFYAGASAPDWVLFKADAIDDRYPSMVEGPLWPMLLSRYEPVLRAGPLLGLHRRAVPLADVLGPVARRAERLGRPFSVPPGAVFARVTVQRTPLGSLAALVFRPLGLSLHVKFADGTEASYRFVPALGAGGFLISPVLGTTDDFARLGSGLADMLTGRAVTEAVLDGSRLAGLFYAADVAVEYQSVTVPDAQTGEDGQALRRFLVQPSP